MDTRTSRVLPVGPTAEFHPPSSELRVDDRIVRLRPQTAAVLMHLLLHPDQVVGKDELLAAVWPGVIVTENSLAQCIAEIRRELGAANQDAVQTIPRRGYRFRPPSQPAPESAAMAGGGDAEGVAAPSFAAQGGVSGPRRSSRWLAFVAASLVVATTGAAGYGWPLMTGRATHFAEAARMSVAVLPLGADAGDDQLRSFARRTTEELTQDLVQMPAAEVIAQGLLPKFSDGAIDAREVGRELGARYVIKGRVLSEGGRRIVDLRLVDAAVGVQLWSEQIGLEPGLLQVEDRDVTGRLAQALKTELLSAEVARRSQRPRGSIAADDLALHAWMLTSRVSREDSANATALARQAIALNPESALAWRTLAASNLADHLEGWSDDPDKSLDTAESAIRRALAIDPGQHQAHTILGAIMAIRGRYLEALAALERELAMGARRDPQVHEWLGITYLWMGKPRQAVQPLETAVWLSAPGPRLSRLWRMLAMANWHIGNLCVARDRAWAAVRTPQPVPGAYETLAAVCTMFGDRGCANDAVAELRRLVPGHSAAKVSNAMSSNQPDFVARQQEYVAALRMAGLR